jgi:anti-sigma B factor antagonist
VSDESGSPLRGRPVLGVEALEQAVVVRLGGELDLYNADQVRVALDGAIRDGTGRVVVDLAEVEFADSTALGVLLEARSKLSAGGLLLAAPRDEIKRALEVSGLDRHLAVHGSVDAALAASSD